LVSFLRYLWLINLSSTSAYTQPEFCQYLAQFILLGENNSSKCTVALWTIRNLCNCFSRGYAGIKIAASFWNEPVTQFLYSHQTVLSWQWQPATWEDYLNIVMPLPQRGEGAVFVTANYLLLTWVCRSEQTTPASRWSLSCCFFYLSRRSRASRLPVL